MHVGHEAIYLGAQVMTKKGSIAVTSPRLPNPLRSSNLNQYHLSNDNAVSQRPHKSQSDV